MQERDNFEDKILDELIADSMKDLYPVDDLLASYQDEDLIEPSPEFKANMESIFKKEHKKLKWQKRRMMMPRIAAAIAVFLVIAVFSINQVPAWREPIYNFFFNTTSDGKKEKVEILEENKDDDFEKYMPKYVPEGFKLVEKFYDEETVQYRIVYESETSNITIFALPKNGDFYLDLSKFEKIRFSNREYYIDNQNRIMWISNHCSFYIKSDLSRQEILEIADSIR